MSTIYFEHKLTMPHAHELTPAEGQREQTEAYARIATGVARARSELARPLTLTEKVLFGHAVPSQPLALRRGVDAIALRPDRVALQDTTGQTTLQQLMAIALERTALPTTLHCDHLIRAHRGAEVDLRTARNENGEIYGFLKRACARFGIGFWEPGSGIIHQVLLENHAFPGGVVIGTDSHTPNAGGLGMLGCGVGGAEAVDVMAGAPFELLMPRLIGIHLRGKLSGWASAKDVALHVCEMLTTRGGTHSVLEYFGAGVEALSCTGKATIANMGAELGATSSIFPFDESMQRYLRAVGRSDVGELAERQREHLRADAEVLADPERFYDRVIEIDLDAVEPYVVGPESPDRARTTGQLSRDVAALGIPGALAAALVGSCTNSSYQDLGRAASIARQAVARGLRAATQLWCVPGSLRTRASVEPADLLAFEQVGGAMLASACGACIGQWQRSDASAGQRNSIITSFNRNFPGRNDGSLETLAFLASPELVVAYALAGTLHFDPLCDTLTDASGNRFKLEPPPPVADVPSADYAQVAAQYVAPSRTAGSELRIAPTRRLSPLPLFPAWDGADLRELPILLYVRGRCTTDHISPAGHWLELRGNLDLLCDNLFTGATNAFGGEIGRGPNLITAERSHALADVARDYKQRGLGWLVVADENYGEGSSREHAAMQVRHLGGRVVLARSFARIHESNLKRHGVLPLCFADPRDHDGFAPDDRVSVLGLAELAPDREVRVEVRRADGSSRSFAAHHSLTAAQIEWFRHGGAVNLLRARRQPAADAALTPG